MSDNNLSKEDKNLMINIFKKHDALPFEEKYKEMIEKNEWDTEHSFQIQKIEKIVIVNKILNDYRENKKISDFRLAAYIIKKLND